MFKALLRDITVVADNVKADPLLAAVNMEERITTLIRENI
jgi:hypothetical protein